MPDGVVVAIYVLAVCVGLITGRGLYALWLAHVRHRERQPDCPARGEVLREARRVQLDIDELTMPRKAQPHG